MLVHGSPYGLMLCCSEYFNTKEADRLTKIDVTCIEILKSSRLIDSVSTLMLANSLECTLPAPVCWLSLCIGALSLGIFSR